MDVRRAVKLHSQGYVFLKGDTMTVDKKLKGLTEQISNLTKGLPNISDYVIYAPVIRSLLESCETIAQKIGRDKIDM